MTMKSTALALLLAFTSLPAMAQSTTGTSTATTSTTVNSTAVLATEPGTSTQNIHYSGSTSAYTTPSVQGSYFAGANPCLIGVGGGGAGGPVGLNFMWGRDDKGCDRRSDTAAWHALSVDALAQAAALHAVGLNAQAQDAALRAYKLSYAAIGRMCQDDNNRKALEATGMACPQDNAKVAAITASNAEVAADAAKVATIQQQLAQLTAARQQIAQLRPVPTKVAATSNMCAFYDPHNKADQAYIAYYHCASPTS